MTSTESFDVFLAHNSQDKPQVRVVSELLKARDLNPWFDEEQIPPGRPFQDIIQQAIPKVKSAAIFIGPNGLGDWEAMELRAFISQCVKNKLPVISVLLPGVDSIPNDLLFLNELRYVVFSENLEDSDALDDLVWGITGERSKKRAGIMPEPPPILPYLCNRSPQKSKLEESLEKRLPNRPFICIVHGNEKECHDLFVERICLDWLPKFLDLDKKLPTINPKSIDWEQGINSEAHLRRLHSNLAEKFAGKMKAPIEEITEKISQYKEPVIIAYYLHTASWQSKELELIENWINFWGRWPKVAPGQLLVITLCIKYKNTSGLSTFQRWKYKRLHGKIMKSINSVKFEKYELSGLTLPELVAIKQSEAEQWVRDHESMFSGNQGLLTEIRKLYERCDSIPMEELADELKKLIKTYRKDYRR